MAWIFWTFLVLAPASIFDLIFLLSLSSRSWIIFAVLSQLILFAFGYWRLKKSNVNDLFFVAAESQKGTRIVKEMWGEVLLIIGAISFILPGFITAFVGSILLFTPTRLLLLELIDQSQ
ncbi:MAG: FxsA family protein [SAR324 cluster bacterium]|nr:FxsA family protein [SAR324 cluster bacterium]